MTTKETNSNNPVLVTKELVVVINELIESRYRDSSLDGELLSRATIRKADELRLFLSRAGRPP